MTVDLKFENILSILESGNFKKLIGVTENEWLDCKGAPYILKGPSQKQELAKDVSGFANAGRGIILIGVVTEINSTHFGEEISKIKPFPQSLVNIKQYRDTLESWLYPTLQFLNIKWFPFHDDPDKGILAIIIPEQPPSKLPIFVIKTVDEKGKRNDVLFGYFERRVADVKPMSIHEIHSGFRYGQSNILVNEHNDNIHRMLRQILEKLPIDTSETLKYEATDVGNVKLPMLKSKGQETQLDNSKLLSSRIEKALEVIELVNKPVYILASDPAKPTSIASLFESKSANIVRLLENPPELRYAGFGLLSNANSKIVRGELRRSIVPGYKSLELWNDGTLLFLATADNDFLSWGKRSQKIDYLRLNQIALIESVYLFVELSRQVYLEADEKPNKIKYTLELRNMSVDSKNCGIIPGPLGTFNMMFGDKVHRAPSENYSNSIAWSKTELNSKRIAFLLISKLYEWFGIEHDYIPYQEKEGDIRLISPEQIIKLSE